MKNKGARGYKCTSMIVISSFTHVNKYIKSALLTSWLILIKVINSKVFAFKIRAIFHGNLPTCINSNFFKEWKFTKLGDLQGLTDVLKIHHYDKLLV